MSVNALTSGAVKGAIIGTIGVLVAPQLTATYLGLQIAKCTAIKFADAHNGNGHSLDTKA